MFSGKRRNQRAMTLIEVLVSIVILGTGLLGAAATQLNALRYTDSSALSSQASFVAYDMMDRIRANVDGNALGNGTADMLSTYALASLNSAPAANLNNARDQDLYDFKANITRFAGDSGSASKIVVAKPMVTITIEWDDSRATNASAQATGDTSKPATKRTFVLSSRIGTGVLVTP
jgi:type IV pilus assembly protein PilV